MIRYSSCLRRYVCVATSYSSWLTLQSDVLKFSEVMCVLPAPLTQHSDALCLQDYGVPSASCVLHRVIRRMAVPSAISDALPKDTIHYGCKILRVTVTPTGKSYCRHFAVAM